MNSTLKHNLKVEPYQYQQEGILYGLDKKRLIIGDEPGLGKAQTLFSKVATPSGFVNIGNLAVGDSLFGRDGNIYEVKGVFPQGVIPVYMIEFSDGSFCKCSADHLWNVRDENRRRRNNGWITKTLSEIMELGLELKSNPKREQSGRKPILKWEIPMCEPVKYDKKDYVISPYIMGAIIGDGHVVNTPHVSFSLPDEKSSIINKIRKDLHWQMSLSEKRYGNVTHYNIVNGSTVDKWHTSNLYMETIRCLKLNVHSKEKFIPEEYKRGSVAQRMELLEGIMDTDGSCVKNRTTFHSTSRRLVGDVRELVQSLGGIAVVHEYDRGDNIEYQLNIRTNFCPFSEDSYKARQWSPNSRFKVTRYIKSVKYLGEFPCVCIKTSADDQLYLTNDFIVTHNTLQSIGIVDTANAYPCLVICPSSLKINWQREFEKFTDKSALVLNNNTKATFGYLMKMGVHHVAIVNYESLKKYFVWDIKSQGKTFRLKDVVFSDFIRVFKSIIIDESHRVKDAGAQQTIFTKGISVGKEYVIMLSGTPVVNRPDDLVAQLSIMNRLKDFGGYSQFVADFCTDPKDKNAQPAVPLSELSKRLYDNCMIRREKSKVLPQLPDKTRIDLYVEISNEEEYSLAVNDLAEYLRQYTECTDRDIRRKMRMEALVKFMTLRSLATKGKVRQAIDFIKNHLANGKKLIVFCALHEVVDMLQKAFPKAVTVTGRDTAISKQNSVDAFQNNPECMLIICSIKAAGVGLTLTSSSSVAFLELPWTYADCCQCEDRAHRIGQKDNVTCYYLLGNDTIDRTIYSLIHKKKSIANEIMNSDDDIPTDEMYFEELIDQFVESHHILLKPINF